MWLDKPRNPNAPLAGLKVLELARILAGPFCGQTLADLGADVIKVEAPEGDGTRLWGPPFVERGNGAREAAYYHGCNRGKRGITADFRNVEDRATVTDLAGQADVVIENFLPGKLARFGLDYESLSVANPRLVYCSISGFGQDGPRRDEPGYDFVIQAMSGFMALTGEPEGEPMKHGMSISDLFCGLYSTIAIQSALALRARTETGQHIDMALYDCSVALLAHQAQSYFTTGQNPPRMGNMHAQVSAYGVFPTKDGPVVLAPANDRLFRKLLEVFERHDLLGDERFATNEARIANRSEIDGIIADETAQWDRETLLRHCREAGVPAGPIYEVSEVFEDPQVQARGMTFPMADGLTGLRSPFRFSDAELALGEASPTLGQDD
ncbi:CaiB/BaiF CoA transferase family protein [Alteriqipengyuania sp.]|uniref:CaiB/BaiF CoA transferase family protein n=1 Tax=Alteriqipengyuania sp. TaxID=2800692 RepID=UPI003512A4A5